MIYLRVDIPGPKNPKNPKNLEDLKKLARTLHELMQKNGIGVHLKVHRLASYSTIIKVNEYFDLSYSEDAILDTLSMEFEIYE